MEGPLRGRYELRACLGRGAAGSVYEAIDIELQRTVAVKRIERCRDVDRRRFEREVKSLARLSHPNIAKVYDAGESSGQLFLVMEFVDGLSLAALLESGNVPRRMLLEILAKVGRGMHHAHERGIVHRDLKPANVLVTNEGEPKIVDFGLARIEDSKTFVTADGALLGTPQYMAPEQVTGSRDEIGPPADVYALGAMLYEVLAGRPPHVAPSATGVFVKVIEEEPIPPSALDPSIEPALEAVVLRALEKPPGARHASAAEFAGEIERYLAGELVAAPGAIPAPAPLPAAPIPPVMSATRVEPAAPHPARPPARRTDRRPPRARESRTTAVVVVAAVAVALAIALTFGLHPAKPAAEPAGSGADAARPGPEPDAGDGEPSELSPTPPETTPPPRAAVDLETRVADLEKEVASAPTLDPGRVKRLIEETRSQPGSEAFAARLDGLRADLDTRVESDRAAYRRRLDRIAECLASDVPDLFEEAMTEFLALQQVEMYLVSIGASERGEFARLDKPVGDAYFLARGLAGHLGESRTSPPYAPPGPEPVPSLGAELTRTIEGGRRVYALAFSPDGIALASAGWGKMVRVWDLESGIVKKTFEVAADLVTSLQFAGPELLAAGGALVLARGGEASLFPLGGEGEPRTWRSPSSPMNALALSGDGRLVALLDPEADGAAVLVLERAGELQLARVAGTTSRVYTLAFQPEGDLLAGGLDEPFRRIPIPVVLWDLSRGGERRELAGHDGPAYALAWSPGGRTLASAGLDGKIRLWDVAAGFLRIEFTGHPAMVHGLAFGGPEGKWLASAGWDDAVRIWDAETGRQLARIDGHGGHAAAVAFHPRDPILATAGKDGRIRLWRLF